MANEHTHNVAAHANEIDARLRTVLDGAARFVPLIAALEREITRCEEDILPMRMSETDGEVLGHVDGMQQRHRSLRAAAAELNRHVAHIFVVAQELQHVQSRFLTAVEPPAANPPIAQ